MGSGDSSDLKKKKNLWLNSECNNTVKDILLYKILIFVEFLSLSFILNTANNHTCTVSYSYRAGVQVTGYQATYWLGIRAHSCTGIILNNADLVKWYIFHYPSITSSSVHLFFPFFNLRKILLLRTLKKSYDQIFLLYQKQWKEQIHYILSIQLVIYLNICSVFVVVFRKSNYPTDLIWIPMVQMNFTNDLYLQLLKEKVTYSHNPVYSCTMKRSLLVILDHRGFLKSSS